MSDWLAIGLGLAGALNAAVALYVSIRARNTLLRIQNQLLAKGGPRPVTEDVEDPESAPVSLDDASLDVEDH